jgi:hypothetical protein
MTRIGRIIVILGAGILLGATLFGLWHVVVGGVINGNARAGLFGLGLALVAGITLSVGWRLAHRRRSFAA